MISEDSSAPRTFKRPISIPGFFPWFVALFLLALTVMRYTPMPIENDAPDEMFAAGRALDIHARVFDGTPHPVGSAASEKVVEKIVAELDHVGVQTTVQDTFYCGIYGSCAYVRNIFGVIPGSEPSEPAVVILSHHDSVPAGPGAADDGHGVAVSIEVARAAKDANLDRTVVIAITDAEEAGLIGAGAAADYLFAEGIEIGVVLNIEARGTSGPGVLFEIGGEVGPIIDAYSEVPRPVTSSVAQPIYEAMPNDTDLTVFKGRGNPGLNLAFVGGATRYHTPLDDFDHLSQNSLQHQGDSILALVLAFGDTEFALPSFSGEGMVYFDVLALFVVDWEFGTTMILAIIAFLLLLAATVRLIRSGTVGLATLAMVMAAWPVIAGLALGAASGMGALLMALGAVPPVVPWPAHPFPVLMAELGAGLAVVYLAVALMSTDRIRAGFWPWWISTWLWWCVLGFVVISEAEAASYVFVVPALFAGLGGIAPMVARIPERAEPRAIAGGLPFLVAATLLVPVAWLVADGIGYSAIAGAAWLGTLVALSAMPFIAAEVGKPYARRWRAPLVAIGATVAGLVLALVMPLHNEDNPKPVNLIYREHHAAGAESATASWYAMTLKEPLSESMAGAADFSEGSEPIVPWSHPLRVGHRASAGVVGLEVPTYGESKPKKRKKKKQKKKRKKKKKKRKAELRGDGDESGSPVENNAFQDLDSPMRPGGRIVKGVFRSNRNGAMGALRWDGDRVVRFRVNGLTPLSSEKQGWKGIDLYGLRPEGIEVQFEIDGEAPFEIWLMDKTYELPPAAESIHGKLPAVSKPFQGGHASIVTRVIEI